MLVVVSLATRGVKLMNADRLRSTCRCGAKCVTFFASVSHCFTIEMTIGDRDC